MFGALSVHIMLKNNEKLDTYWLTFPKDPNLPFGIGVTAVSEDDAFKLIRDQDIDKWYESAQEINIQKGVIYEYLPCGQGVIWSEMSNCGHISGH